MTKKPFLKINATEIEKLSRYLLEKPRILILPHAIPDGDAAGSALGAYHALRSIGLTVDIADRDPFPEKAHFLPGFKDLKHDFNPADYDAVWFTDCGAQKQTKFHDQYPEIFSDQLVKINIDHHVSNDLWGEINFVDTKASSTCEILANILWYLDFPITPDVATCLLTGIYTDTGSFQHQNTTPATYFTAGELSRLGANTRKIAKNFFQTYDANTLKLWAKVLENLSLTPEGAAITGVKQSDYESLGTKREDLEGVIDFINSMPEAQYSVLLSEDNKGNVKASMRTRKPDVNVCALAEKFGGGGHIKAAGFLIPKGRLTKEVKWKIET